MSAAVGRAWLSVAWVVALLSSSCGACASCSSCGGPSSKGGYEPPALTPSVEPGLTVQIAPVADAPGTAVRWEIKSRRTEPAPVITYFTPLAGGWDGDYVDVIDEQGRRAHYIGPRVKRSAPSRENQGVVMLGAGASLGAEVDLNEAYELRPGKVSVTFRGQSLVNHLPDSNTIELVVPAP